MKRVDLHTHTRYSDGTLTPAELVARASESKVETLILTDHDSVSGFPEAAAAAEKTTVDVLCGIEINTCRVDQVHILGYGFDRCSPGFTASLERFRKRRASRIEKIVARLQEHGIDITVEDVKNGSKESLGRPHVADALRRKGVVRNRRLAFERYLLKGKPGYTEPMGPTALEAISVINDAGGFAVLSHPETLSHWDDFQSWVDAGLAGLEAYYGTHSPSQINKYVDLAKEHGLLVTGGSDFHGPRTGRERSLGVPLPDDVWERFEARLESSAADRTDAGA